MRKLSAKVAYEMGQRGDWDNIDFSELTSEDLNYEGRKWETLLHLAALSGKLSLFPKRLLTHEALSKEDSWSQSIYFIAADNGNIGDIPKELLTPTLLTQKLPSGEPGILSNLIEKYMLETLPKECLTKEILLTKICPEGSTYAHKIAITGSIEEIPQDLRVPEIIFAQDNGGVRVIDWIAHSGQLNLIKKEYLTQEVITYKSQGLGTTLIHQAAKGSCICDLPQNEITKDRLLEITRNDIPCPLELAIKYHCLPQIAPEHLNWRVLSTISSDPNQTLWEKFVSQYLEELDAPALQKILKNLSDKQLLEIKTKENHGRDPLCQNFIKTVHREKAQRKILKESKRELPLEI